MKMSNRHIWIFVSLFFNPVLYSAAQGPIHEIEAVVKGTVSLPCSIKPPIPNDTTILVVWYRNEMDAIYSYDSRGKKSETGVHWKNNTVIGNRAYFRAVMDPATLTIEDVKVTDEGSYRCRVDFMKSPTKNHKIRLRVIVPSEKPLIYDQRGKVTSNAGPYEEYTDVKFVCRVYGGRPVPTVTWWRGEVKLNSPNTINRDQEFVECELTIRKITRDDLRAVYTCQASNNNISVPQSTSVTLDLYLSPLSVSILSSRQPLSVDRKYDVVCQSAGSRPPVKISWWKDNEKLTNFTDIISTDENITTSVLSFTPAVSDHNRTLICRAINTKLNSGVNEDRWVLDVTFVPEPRLEFQTQLLNAENVEEGDDVYFRCKIYANPRAYKVVWKHNGFVVQDDPKSGVFANYETLGLRSVSRRQEGNYTCIASNVEGDNQSNALELHVKYKPVCKNSKHIYGLARNENANITCEVDAYPSADTFRWSFTKKNDNNESDSSHLDRRRTESKKNFSVLRLVPVSEHDYGEVTCSARNPVGEQTCTFKIIPAGRPESPYNCTTVNQTSSAVGIECGIGFDGGQSPTFVLLMFQSGILIANTSALYPSFLVDELPPGTNFEVHLYAENGRGRSPPLVIETSTLNPAEKHTGVPMPVNYTPYVVLLIGMTVFCSLSAVIIMGAIRAQVFFASGSLFHHGRSSSKKDVPTLQKTLAIDVDDDDDKNPDVIPSTKAEDEYEVLHLNRDDPSKEHSFGNESAEAAAIVVKDELNNFKSTRNGVCGKNKFAHQNARSQQDDQVEYADLMFDEREDNRTNRNESNESNSTIYAQIDHRKISKPSKNFASCNVIRSPKEIITKRTPLISSPQESCV